MIIYTKLIYLIIYIVIIYIIHVGGQRINSTFIYLYVHNDTICNLI
jgi:hypothetical protein